MTTLYPKPHAQIPAQRAAQASLVGVADRSTEGRSDTTRDIDRLSIRGGLVLLAQEFRRPFDVFQEHAIELAPLVDAVVACVRSGHRVHLFGAGTSGRLAALDSAEIPPTFGLPPNLFQAHIAGGPTALTTAVEDAEDDGGEGGRQGSRLAHGDVAIGVTASGKTPFVLSALAAAKSVGAFTALIDCNGPRRNDTDCHVVLPTGPEPITGSTRMNAATAQKLALNAVSTLAMVHLGRTYSNWMVFLQPNNAKLRRRQALVLNAITGAPEAAIESVLETAGGDGGLALGVLMHGWTIEQARDALNQWTTLRPLLDRNSAAEGTAAGLTGDSPAEST